MVHLRSHPLGRQSSLDISDAHDRDIFEVLPLYMAFREALLPGPVRQV